MTANTVVVCTVGLDVGMRSELSIQLSYFPKLRLEHLAGWNFNLLNADVIVLGTDVRVGQEVLEIFRRYAGATNPILVTYSDSDERSRALGGMHGEPPFVVRLQQALHRAGSSPDEKLLRLLGRHERHSDPLRGEGPEAKEGIQWMN